MNRSSGGQSRRRLSCVSDKWRRGQFDGPAGRACTKTLASVASVYGRAYVAGMLDAKPRVESRVGKLTGKKVRARYEQDTSVLGGVVVRVGSTIYDGSVKGQLEKIREAIRA